jgi:hypothetical protein
MSSELTNAAEKSLVIAPGRPRGGVRPAHEGRHGIGWRRKLVEEETGGRVSPRRKRTMPELFQVKEAGDE